MADKYLTHMLTFLRRDDLASADGVRVTITPGVAYDTGPESCNALFDDEDVVVNDALGTSVMETQTVLRIVEGIITRPTTNATVVVTFQDGSTEDFTVREVRKDPQQPGMWRVQVARA